MKIYISGPIAFDPEHGNVFDQAFQRLRDIDHDPLDPRQVPPWCSQLPCADEGNGQMGKEHSWRCYIRGDLHAMLECHAVLMLPKWETSHGARLEQFVAASAGLTIYYDPFDVPAA